MSDEYVNFGDVAHNHLGMTCQYAVGFLKGSYGYPNLSEGLRVKGDPNMYHSFQIHKDDIAELVARVQKFRHETVNFNPRSTQHVFTGDVCSCGYDARTHAEMY